MLCKCKEGSPLSLKRSVNKISSALDYSIMHMDVDQNLFAATSEDRGAAITAKANKETGKFTGN